MPKELHCGDVIPGCDQVIRGESEQEVMAKGAEHARNAHSVNELDEATKQKVRSAIRDV